MKNILLASAIMVFFPAAESNCRGFIDSTCCCTNDCCFEISMKEIIPVDPDGNEWIVNGKRVPRTDWSKDENAYRCACHSENGKWVIDLNDFTRCLYPVKMEAGV